MVWQVVDDDIEFSLFRICAAQAFECCQEIENPLSLVDGPGEAVTVNVIEPEELLRAGQSPVRGPKPIWVPNLGPMLTVNGFEFEGSPFIEAENHTVLWSLMIEFKNAVFFLKLGVWRFLPSFGSLYGETFPAKEPPYPFVTDIWQQAFGAAEVSEFGHRPYCVRQPEILRP